MRSTFCFVFSLMLGLFPAFSQTNPVQVATQARFDILSDVATGPLTNGYMLAGDASVARQTWLTNTDQPRSFTVNFTIVHFAWTEAAFTFTPTKSGNVTLTLRGPYQASPAGPIYRQEVLWDAVFVTNAAIANGSFESVSGGLPVGWTRPYGDGTVDTNPSMAVDGSRYARLWHDGPLNNTFFVTGGVPVTLHCYARAYFPSNFTDMASITGTNTPAHQAARKFMRGVNLSGFFDGPPGQNYENYFTTDFTEVRGEGFDHVRLPIAWSYYTGPAPGYTLSSLAFLKTDFLITNSLNAGLSVLVDIHNFDELCTNFTGATNKFIAIWDQLAAYYSNMPPQVAFELDNEPNNQATTQLLNPIYAEVIRRIRLTNPNRTIFVGPGMWNSITELSNLLLPATDSNLVVTVHCYDPLYFTHQGASWVGPDVYTLGVQFPGPPPTPLTPAAGIGVYVTNWLADYNTLPAAGNPSSPLAFRSKLKIARQWADYSGRPVHIGEFGCYTTAPTNSRVNFYTALRSTAEALSLGWAMWDWKSGFMYWNPGTAQPYTGMRDAMFPRPQLICTAPGQIQFTSAVAKTFVLQRTPSLLTSNWVNVQTQTLTTPQCNFTDPAGQTNSSYYRALWLK